MDGPDHHGDPRFLRPIGETVNNPAGLDASNGLFRGNIKQSERINAEGEAQQGCVQELNASIQVGRSSSTSFGM